MKKGDLFVSTSGDYSDYIIRAHFRASKDFSYGEMREKYVEQLPMVPVMKTGEWVDKSKEEYERDKLKYRGYSVLAPSKQKFVIYDEPVDTGELRKEYSTIDGFHAFLIRQGLVEEVDCVEYNYDYDNKKD